MEAIVDMTLVVIILDLKVGLVLIDHVFPRMRLPDSFGLVCDPLPSILEESLLLFLFLLAMIVRCNFICLHLHFLV
jgi:hypothetical protein